MNVLNSLVGLNSVILIFLVVNVFKPFIGSYAAKKGENLATKEDIAQLTKIAEEIKAEISDKVWDRQKQWELKRDVVFEVMQALGELEDSLISLHSVHVNSVQEGKDPNEFVQNQIHNELISFDTCNRKFFRVMFKARLVVGKELHHALTECAEETRSISRMILKKENAQYIQSESEVVPRKLAEINTGAFVDRIFDVVLAARKELKTDFALAHC
jgi:hypothetical protein